jgi:hypothetical protein
MNKSTDLSRYAHSVLLMELATCDIEVDVIITVQVGVANSTARGRGSCDTVRWLGIPTIIASSLTRDNFD